MSEAPAPEAPQQPRVSEPRITVADVVRQCITILENGDGNALEFKFAADCGEYGHYTVHLHVCVQPAKRPTVN